MERQGAQGPAGLHLLLPTLAPTRAKAPRRETSNQRDRNKRDSDRFAFDSWGQLFSCLLNVVSNIVVTFEFLGASFMSFGQN